MKTAGILVLAFLLCGCITTPVIPLKPPATGWNIDFITDIRDGNLREGFTVEILSDGATKVYHWKNKGWKRNWHETTEFTLCSEDLDQVYKSAAFFIQQFSLPNHNVAKAKGSESFVVSVEIDDADIACRCVNVEAPGKVSSDVAALISTINRYLPKEKQIR